MYLNKHEGNTDSFQTGHPSCKLKAKHHCTRCSQSFQFAFQLRSHLRCHLLKAPSAYVHDMKNSQNESVSQFRLLEEETIKNDDADLTVSNQKRLFLEENSFGVDRDLYIGNSKPSFIGSKSECSVSEFTGIQRRKRKTGQTLAEICGKLQKSKSLKNLPAPLPVSVGSLAGSAEHTVENPLEGNSSEKRCSQNTTQNKTWLESCKRYQQRTNTVQNILCEKETSDDDDEQSLNSIKKPAAAAQQVDTLTEFTTSTAEKTASLPENAVYTDAITDDDVDALEYDKQEHIPQKSTSLQERVRSDVFKTSQKQVTLGDVQSAEQVLPLTDSSEFQESLCSQPTTTKGFTCLTCGSTYSKNSGLALHLLAHKRREMVVKFKKRDQTKLANVSSGRILGSNFTDTSKEAQIAVPDFECLPKESVNETECMSNVFESQCSSANTSQSSANSICLKTTPVNPKYDLMGESALAECPETCSGRDYEISILQKTGESLDKQTDLSVDEQITVKEKKPVASCYKKKMEAIPCQYCYTLVSKRNMSRHRSIHCPVLTLPCYTKAKCHICLISLHSQELSHHLEVVHEQGVMRVRSCNVCFKGGFESFGALQDHKKEHFLNINDIDLRPQVYDRNFPGCGSVCPFCNTETLSASNIRSHIVSHMVDKDCSRNQLRKGEKFGCPVCLKTFGLSTRIENHILSHWKIRLYECPTCLKQFTRYDAMARHCTKKHKTNITNELSEATRSLELPEYRTKSEVMSDNDESDM